MKVLGIDTSMPVMSVALIDGERLLGSVAAAGEGSRNEKLLPAVDWLLKEARVAAQELSLVAVTRGPGSFTGTRVGLATAQGLALSLKVNLFTVGTHDAAAESAGEGHVVVAGDAGRSEFYVSTYHKQIRHSGPELLNGDALRAAVRSSESVVMLETLILRENLALLCARRAARLEQMGEGATHRDPAPLYVRLAEAEVQLQQRNRNA